MIASVASRVPYTKTSSIALKSIFASWAVVIRVALPCRSKPIKSSLCPPIIVIVFVALISPVISILEPLFIITSESSFEYMILSSINKPSSSKVCVTTPPDNILTPSVISLATFISMSPPLLSLVSPAVFNPDIELKVNVSLSI